MSDANDLQMHRDMGRLEGQVAALNGQVAGMQSKINEMHDAIVSARGGWRVLVVVGGAIAAVSSLLTKLLSEVWK